MAGWAVLDGSRMKESPLDPYQTPSAELSTDAPDGTWFVEDRRLFFRDDAILPEVDLFTGRDDLPLVRVSRAFEAVMGGRSAWLYVAIMAMAVMAVAVRQVVDLNLILAILGLILLAHLMGLLLKKSVVSGILHFHSSELSECRPKWRLWAQWALAMVGVGFFLGTLFVDSFKWMFLGFGVMCSCLVILVVLRLAPGGLKCTGEQDGWFVLEGVPDVGLRSLASRQSVAGQDQGDE